MVVFDRTKKIAALLLVLVIAISAVPAMILYADNSDSKNYLEVYDPLAQLKAIIASGTADYSNSDFSVYGNYDGIKNAEFTSIADKYMLYNSALNVNNISVRPEKNAICVRQSYNGSTKGNNVKLIFTAPYSGIYKLVPGVVNDSGGKSMFLQPKYGVNASASNCKNFTQTFSVKKGSATLWSKKLELNENSLKNVSGNIASDISAELAKGEQLVFEFKSPEAWAQCDMYVNFTIALTEYKFEAVSGVYFQQENYLVSKDSSINLSPVIVPPNVANNNVSYSVADEKILTVDEKGKVTPKSKGYTTVTVTTEEGGFKASAIVGVYEDDMPSYSATELYSAAVDKLGGLGTVKTVENDTASEWSTLYKSDDGYVRHEKITYNLWSSVSFHSAADANALGETSAVMFHSGVPTLYYGWQQNLPHGTAIEFTAPEYGIYSLTSDGNNGKITIPSLTLGNISNGDIFKINFYVNGVLQKVVELSKNHTEEVFPVLNHIEMQKGDKLTIELETNCWVKGSIALSPKMIRVLEKPQESPVTEIRLSETEISVSKNGTKTLIASVFPIYADDKTLIYESADTAVAKVSETGVVTAVGIGDTVITVKSKKYPEISATCKVSIEKPSYNVITSVKEAADNVKEAGKLYDAEFSGTISAGVLSGGEYNNFKYATSFAGWGAAHRRLTNTASALYQYVEVGYGQYTEIGSFTANNWIYTGFTADADGIYTIKPNAAYPNINLAYVAGATSADALISWGEDYPLYVRITKNGEKIWPAGDVQGYELKPSGQQSVAMPTIENIALYKGDSIRVEVLGQNRVNRHLAVRYNYDVEMQKSVVPAVRVQGIGFAQQSYELSIDQTVKLAAQIIPANATNRNVSYISSDPQVVSVDRNGVMTALKQGNATVYAISLDNGDIRNSCNVTVTSFRIIDYSIRDMIPNIDSQLNGKVVVTALPIEMDTNWTVEGVNSKGEWVSASKVTTFDWNNDKQIDCRQFDYGWKNSSGIEGNQPFMLSETGTISTVFTATRAGTYKLGPNPTNGMISIPNTYVTTRVPEKQKDKLWSFKIYINDKELFHTQLSCKGVNSVAFPTFENLYMMSGDIIRFVLEVNKEAASQMDIYFDPIISLITPDKNEYAPIGEDREYIMEPNTSVNGKIRYVHPNGLDVYFKSLKGSSANKLEIAADGSFTYTPARNYRGIDTHTIQISDSRGKSTKIQLKFIVGKAYDGPKLLSEALLAVDPDCTGKTLNMTFGDAIWRFQYTYDGLTYPNGAPKYYDTDLAECIVNPGWWGYTAYANGMPQTTIHSYSGIPVVDIMAGEKPWNTSPVGAMTFIAPSDGTYLLKGNEQVNKFVATNAANNGISQPIKVWISKNGTKIWPADDSAVELTAQNPEIDFPELQIAMKQGDNVKICVSGHPANWKKNTVAIAPIMYDIGAYKLSLDPEPRPEGGVVIVDDDGEPYVKYSNFSLRKGRKSVDDDPFIEPIINENYTLNKIKTLKKIEPFKLQVNYKECEGADTYLVNVYRRTEFGYELFAEQSTDKLTMEIVDFSEGEYTIQVLALDKEGQYIEIYTPRDFTVDKNGNFKFDGFPVVTLLIIIASVLLLAAMAIVAVFIIRKRR